jgi:hypothetical protein
MPDDPAPPIGVLGFLPIRLKIKLPMNWRWLFGAAVLASQRHESGGKAA